MVNLYNNIKFSLQLYGLCFDDLSISLRLHHWAQIILLKLSQLKLNYHLIIFDINAVRWNLYFTLCYIKQEMVGACWKAAVRWNKNISVGSRWLSDKSRHRLLTDNTPRLVITWCTAGKWNEENTVQSKILLLRYCNCVVKQYRSE